MNEELDQVLEAIPLDIEHAFEDWWKNPNATSGVLCPEDEAVAYAAFAAGVEHGRCAGVSAAQSG